MGSREEQEAGARVDELAEALAALATPEARVELIKERAGAAYKAGAFELAAGLYTHALQLGPSRDEERILLGHRSACRCALKSYTDALADAERCTELAPQWAKGFARRGAALHGLHRWSESIEAYEAGLALDPTHAPLTLGLRDVRRRRQLAAGDWWTLADGSEMLDVVAELNPPMKLADGTSVSAAQEPLLLRPARLSITEAGEVCVCDAGANQVRLFGTDGRLLRTFNMRANCAPTPRTDGAFASATSAACDGKTCYLADARSSCVIRLAREDRRAVGDRRDGEAAASVYSPPLHNDRERGAGTNAAPPAPSRPRAQLRGRGGRTAHPAPWARRRAVRASRVGIAARPRARRHAVGRRLRPGRYAVRPRLRQPPRARPISRRSRADLGRRRVAPAWQGRRLGRPALRPPGPRVRLWRAWRRAGRRGHVSAAGVPQPTPLTTPQPHTRALAR